MAKVIITPSLFEEIQKKFKGESHKIIDLLESLEKNPKKGKILGGMGNIIIKETRYKSFRFYFIVDGYKLKAIKQSELIDVLIKFIAMSDKKYQQETIDKIKDFLKKFGKDAMKEE